MSTRVELSKFVYNPISKPRVFFSSAILFLALTSIALGMVALSAAAGNDVGIFHSLGAVGNRAFCIILLGAIGGALSVYSLIQSGKIWKNIEVFGEQTERDELLTMLNQRSGQLSQRIQFFNKDPATSKIKGRKYMIWQFDQEGKTISCIIEKWPGREMSSNNSALSDRYILRMYRVKEDEEIDSQPFGKRMHELIESHSTLLVFPDRRGGRALARANRSFFKSSQH